MSMAGGAAFAGSHQQKVIMSYNSPFERDSRASPAYGPSIFIGLRRYMLQVYNFMAARLGVTGLVAYGAVATGFHQ